MNAHLIRQATRLSYILILCILSTACGGLGGDGGGGGLPENYEGDVYLELERGHIDSGDLNKVEIEIVHLNKNGAILKIKIPRSLKYVPHSTVFFSERENSFRQEPTIQAANETERYIVFFLDSSDTIDGDYVSLTFNLKAVSSDEEAYIEIDLDNNDPSIIDSREFKIENPKFTARQRHDIYIEP